ncbi:MAG TPA: lipopolysaccharide heptosyltransferase I [Burkholderiales bacterium]|jgi:heptosyltransferase-1|nr:lipopolysaccharide heptosyltransferase I [Burkholderiales bacterium]
MKTILFVKTSSLGDVVHNCPAVSDAARAAPGAAIDWIVEEPFAGIAAMHRAVRRVIPVALRRWRGALWKPSVWSEIGAWRRQVRAERYDAVIDTQSLLKSVLISRAASGTLHGLDRASAREWLAPSFYDVRHPVPRNLHAVQRNRLLTASALGYEVSEAADYGLRVPQTHKSGYVVLLTMTSRADKLWAEERWVELGRNLGAPTMLPWGSEPERERAQRISAAIGGTVLPRKNLEELARLFVGARGVVGLDTGLTHLAAALGVPTVGIYCGSDPALTGLYGAPLARNAGASGQAPTVAEVLRLLA